ncbi:MAG: hypothetical protein SGPRY_000586 [Prymnesium sp.]
MLLPCLLAAAAWLPSSRPPAAMIPPARGLAVRQQQRQAVSKLLLSVLIDLIGMATYLLPVAGEAGDVAWAPISALLLYQLYGSPIITGIAFVEELLPGLDIIPTATIAWLLENTEFGRNFNAKEAASDRPPYSSSNKRPTGDGMRSAEGAVVDDEKRA